jgi:hypothetical protein
MAKLTNVRERVHQPFRDTFCRLSGFTPGTIQDRTDLFTITGKNDAETNLKQGSVLPSDQSMVVLALRVFLWFRPSTLRGVTVTVAGGTDYPQMNGDFIFQPPGAFVYNAAQSLVADGQAPGDVHDAHRLYWQASEQLLWNFGAGEKLSLTSMPSAYMPFGGGLHGDLGNAQEFVQVGVDRTPLHHQGIMLWNNGMPDHTGILRLARAILIPPRQNIKCNAQIVAFDGANSALFGSTQNTRNMLSLRDNLNAVDLINKVISFTMDGLFSRDVQ